MQTQKTPIAVISGDIVHSTNLTHEKFETLLARLKAIQRLVSEGHPSNAHSIIRGDEFQSVVHDFGSALRYSIIYRVGIKALGKPFDCRISFAIAANSGLRELVSESMGEAFVSSGRGLRAMKASRLVFHSEHIELTEQFDLLFKYLDRQLTELTPRQCEVMLPMLKSHHGLSVGALAKQLNIAAATTSKSLKASGWSLISELNERFFQQVKGFSHV